MTWVLVVIGLILFIDLVLVHEWGHYIAAKRSGVEVEEFGLGFPPRARSLGLRKGTLFTLNWLPLGGFVKLKGEHDADTGKGTFGAAKLTDKVKIMTAGVGMNLLTAFVMLTVLAWIGMPQLAPNQFTVASDARTSGSRILVSYVETGSPAEKAGIKVQDEVQTIGGVKVDSAQKLKELTKQNAGKQTQVVVYRDGQIITLETTLRSLTDVEASQKTSEPKGHLGVSPSEFMTKRYFWSAPIVAAGTIVQFTVLTLQGLGGALAALFQGNAAQASSNVAGPIGIFVILQEASKLGFPFMLILIAVISLTLAIMNILPIPALDGGRLFVTLGFRAFGKKLTKSTEDRIHGTGFAVLIVLILLITFVDIKRFI